MRAICFSFRKYFNQIKFDSILINSTQIISIFRVLIDNSYFLQLKANFIPEEKGYAIKITDTLNRYSTTTIPVFNNNLYVLCTTKVKSFGPKMTNNMITIEMSK